MQRISGEGGDGSAQRGRSVIFTIALLPIVFAFVLYSLINGQHNITFNMLKYK